MRTLMCSEYDKVGMMCGPILHARNEADAIRLFNRRFKDRDDIEDYDLLKVGYFDTDKGIVEPVNPPEVIPWNTQE